MEIDSRLLIERKWSFLLIFFIVLFNPLFYFWAGDISLKEKFLLWIVCLLVGLSLSSIDMFIKKAGEKFYLIILFLLSLPANIIVWSYLYISHLYMRGNMFWVIYDTNFAETEEYIDQFIPWQIILVTIFYIALGIFFIVKGRTKYSLSVKKSPVLFVFPSLIIATILFFTCLSRAIPAFELYKSYFLFVNESRLFENRKEPLNLNVQCSLPDSTDHVFIILFGESASTCHMGLYGYHRPTTPRMESLRSELDVYSDVVTPEAHTITVMQKALTFANHDHPEYYHEKASVVELFNAAGFETYWISNQAYITVSYGAISRQSKHVYDWSLEGQPDEILLPSLKDALNDGIKGNKVIFIHLMGNHYKYNMRYPASFNHFDNKKDGDLVDLGFRDEEAKKIIDEYDNSILYGDFIYDSIIKELKALNVSSYLLFFSDHGEEVYDTRKISGHHLSNVYPCQSQIPFVLWRSEKYRKEKPELIIDTARPYSTENVIYSISTLSGLEYEEDIPSYSLFSSEYIAPEVRWIGEEDYENILKK